MISNDKELERIKNEVGKLERKKQEAERQLAQMHKTHERQLTALGKKYETEMDRLKGRHSNDEGRVEQLIEGIEADITSLHNEHAERSRQLADERQEK